MLDDGDDACDGDDVHSFTMSHNHSIPPSIVHVGCHHYYRVMPIRSQVGIFLERGTAPELSDSCDMCYHFAPLCARSLFNACVLSLS